MMKKGKNTNFHACIDHSRFSKHLDGFFWCRKNSGARKTQKEIRHISKHFPLLCCFFFQIVTIKLPLHINSKLIALFIKSFKKCLPKLLYYWNICKVGHNFDNLMPNFVYFHQNPKTLRIFKKRLFFGAKVPDEPSTELRVWKKSETAKSCWQAGFSVKPVFLCRLFLCL